MATNLADIARRMYAAKKFTNIGGIISEKLQAAAKEYDNRMQENIREQEERDNRLAQRIGSEPQYDLGGVPEPMLPAVSEYVTEQKDAYYQMAIDLENYKPSDPEYRDIVNKMNQVKFKFNKLKNDISAFTQRADTYREQQNNFSNANDPEERNIISEIYGEEFKNFAIVDDKLVVQSDYLSRQELDEDGVPRYVNLPEGSGEDQSWLSLDDIHGKYDRLIRPANEANTVLNNNLVESRNNGRKGVEWDDELVYVNEKMIRETINAGDNARARQTRKQSLALDDVLQDGGFRDWYKMNGSLRFGGEGGPLIDENGLIDRQWITDEENDEQLGDMLVEWRMGLLKTQHDSGYRQYKKAQNELKNSMKNRGKGENLYSNIQGEISTIVNSNNLDKLLEATEDEEYPPIWEANLGPGSGKSSGNYKLIWDSKEKEFQVQKGQGSSAGDYRWVIQDSLPFPDTNKFYKEDRQELLNFLEKEIGWIQNRQTSNIEVDEQFDSKPFFSPLASNIFQGDGSDVIRWDSGKSVNNANTNFIPTGEDARNLGKNLRETIGKIF